MLKFTELKTSILFLVKLVTCKFTEHLLDNRQLNGRDSCTMTNVNILSHVQWYRQNYSEERLSLPNARLCEVLLLSEFRSSFGIKN